MATKPIARKQAEKVLANVKRAYRVYIEAGEPEPWIAEPGHETDGYAISWEEGPYDFAMEFLDKVYEDPTLEVAGVFMEPVNGWCLGLYRDDEV